MTAMTQLHVCWNRVFWKAFHINDWESVKVLQALCGRLDFFTYMLHVGWFFRPICYA